MTKFVTANLDLPSSNALLSAIANHEDPVEFTFNGESHLVLTAWIDGCETQYQLVLSQDGCWCMRAVVEV